MLEEKPIRVLLVDDHQMVRQGLLFFLSTQPGITVVGEAATAEEALDLVHKLQPDVVLMDIVLPKLDGIEAIRTIHATHPRAGASYICTPKLPAGWPRPCVRPPTSTRNRRPTCSPNANVKCWCWSRTASAIKRSPNS